MKARKNIIFIYIGLWFLINLLFLDRFPFMHSDESWLAGLTREMMQNGLNSTEPFFDLLPRYPHAIKLLFHLLQMPFLAVLGYSLFSVRLISLLFGALTLAVFYGLARLLTKKRGFSLAFTVILSLDIQFLYASHTARQDIIIAFGILAAVYYVFKNLGAWNLKKDVLTGALVGVFIGVHPNSLMVAFAAGAAYLYGILQKKLRLKNLLVLVGTVAGFAAVFVLLSLSFDPQFFAHYARYGGELGVAQTLAEKLRAFPEYFLKLFLQISGTYYTPFIKPQLILFGAVALFLLASAFRKREALQTLLPFLAVVAAILLIGRYSQPAVIVLFPLGYLMALSRIDLPPKRVGAAGVALLGILIALLSFFSVRPYLNDDYKAYLAELRESVPAGARTLANLNAEFAFERGALLDYRNLQYMEEQGLTFAEYVEKKGVEYIVYPAEMDFIYAKRPVYNILYGNLYPYYEEVQRFLEERCTRVAAFTSPYAMRIPRYMYEGAWEVRVYRVEGEKP
ncbi:MAG: glycosyltransferase family 39 protein [Eubacteriales bacterium]|nr:glycosyltransferase family 39 protein [Eubacteriales bacterium]